MRGLLALVAFLLATPALSGTAPAREKVTISPRYYGTCGGLCLSYVISLEPNGDFLARDISTDRLFWRIISAEKLKVFDDRLARLRESAQPVSPTIFRTAPRNSNGITFREICWWPADIAIGEPKLCAFEQEDGRIDCALDALG